MQVSRSVQQRLVHRQDFAMAEAASTVEELSVDGGNIRIRTPEGEPCSWKGYKAVCLHEQEAIAVSFGQNAVVIDGVNVQPLAVVLTCLGDGHDGIWNIISQFALDTQRREVQGLVSFDGKLAQGGRFPPTTDSGGNVAVARTSGSRYCLCRLSTISLPRTFVSISTSIVTALSTISIIKPSRFAPSALALWSQRSSKSTGKPKFQERSGRRKMFLKCWLIVVPTSMD